MKTVIYLDVLLLVNFIIAYFLLMAAGLLSGLRSGFPRMLAAAGVAALSSLILLAPELPYVLQVGYKVITAAGIVAVAFGAGARRHYVTAVCWYAALNVLLAGLTLLVIAREKTAWVQAANLTVYLQISPILLLLLSGGCWGVVELLMRLLEKPGGEICRTGLEAELCGTTVRLRAVLDTGCHLMDPITCMPVLMVSFPASRARLPAVLASWLAEWFEGRRDASLPDDVSLRLIPCKTATGQILLPGLAVKNIGIITERGVIGSGRRTVAFSPQDFGEGMYEALYGNDFF